MMHRIQSLLLTLVLFFATSMKAASIQKYWGPITRQLKSIDKTLNMPGLGTLDGYNTALLKTPVLEILYAWQAFDTWEAYGTQFPSMKSNFQPITDAISVASYSDVTTDLQAALNLNKSGSGKGGIYIPRFIEGVTSKLKSASRHVDWTGFTFPEASPALSFASINETFDEHQFGRAPILPMGTSWDKCPSSPFFVSGAIDSACTKYARYASATMGPVKCGTINSPSHGTTGIVYRDANGIHFRRFEGWQNIALPMVSSILLGQNPGGSCDAVIGGYIYNHQLEETGRGLVTGTAVGASPLYILATDRFGWGHMSLSMPGGGTISPTSGQTGERYIPGTVLPIEAIGPDVRLIHSHVNANAWFDSPHCIDPFMCAWSTSGIALSAKKNGYPMYPDFNCDGCYQYRGGTISVYKYYDENNTLQSIPINSSLDTANTPYPGAAGKQLPFWFAFDRTENGMSYRMGTGAPESEADITKGSNATGAITTLYSNKAPLAIVPYLRNFAFTSLSTSSSILNIQSRYINPAQKFCTPPFCGGRFLFWRDAWQLPNPTSFTLTFKARGNNIQVAFGTPTPANRAANSTGFDVSYNYAIRAGSQGITIEKGAKGPITNQSGGNPAPGSKSLTPNALTTSTLVTAPGLIVDNNETYNDYWISINNGTIQFGTGIYPGKNVCATATDAATPLPNNYYYCFSGDVRSTDYINIQASAYALAITTGTSNSAETTANNGQYSFWQPTQVFPTVGRGALVLNYTNTTASTDPNPLIMLGLTTSATAKQLLKNTQATDTPGAAAAQQQAIAPDYQIQWGTNGNTAHQIFSKASAVMTTTVPVNPDGTPGPPVIPTSSTPRSIWVAYNNGTIAYGSGSIIGQNLMSIWSDPSPSTNAPSIDAFIVATQSTTMQISVTNVQSIPDQTSYRANPGSIPTLQPLWQFNTPNSGAINFSVSSATGPASGATTSTVKTASSSNGTAQIGLCSSGTNATASPVYEIVINELDGTAYVRKQTVKQSGSVVFLTPTQVPTTEGTHYWAAFHNGTILLGTGINPLDISSLILSWQDSTFTSAPTGADGPTTPPVTRFTLSAANNTVTFNNISIPDFSPYATAFTSTGQALQQQAATQLAWTDSAATLALTSANTNLLYWHQQLQFNQPGSTSFAYTVQKKDNNPLTLYIGLSDTLPSQAGTTPLSGAKYYLTLTDTGTIQITNGQNATAPTATDAANNPSSISNIAALKKLLDGNAHTLWVGITTTNVAATSTTSAATVATIKVGIDSAQGTSPIFTYQLVPTTTMTAQKSTMKLPIILGYIGLGGNSSGVNLSAIQTGIFSDPTTYTTTGTGQFMWQKYWTFGQPDEESISFTLQAQAPTGSQSNQPVAIIGLTTSTDAASTATGSKAFNGASYIVSIDYTQQVSVMKVPNFTSRLGNVLYSRQNPDGTSPFTPTAINATPCSANISDNKPHACTLSFDHGLMRLSIAPAATTATPQPAQQVVWTFADSTPITGISQFSFTSTNNTVVLTNIATLGAQSLDTVQGTFARLLTTLATTPSTVVTELTSVVAQRLHVADAQSASFFLSNVVQVLNDNAEVFTDTDRTTIADVLTTALPEPLLQVNGQTSSVLTTCIATMTGTLNWPTVIYGYYTDSAAQSGVPAKQSQINTVFNPTKANLVPTAGTPAGMPIPLAATDPRRVLLMHKIARLSSLPSSALNMSAPAGQTTIPSVLLGIQQLPPALIPFGTFLTPAEQKIIASLNTLNNPSGILSNTQDPASMLTLMPSIADRNVQISGLQGLLTAQYNALANPSISKPIAPLSTTAVAGQASQVQQIMNWLFVIAYNRDELTITGQKNLLLALQLTQALPFFKGITVDANTFNSVVASTTGIATTSTIATSPAITLASGAVASIAALPGIPDLVALANAPVNFSYQVAKLVAQQSVIAITSTNDQKRMSFFQTLSLIPTSTASMLPADVTTLNTKVVNPLQGTPLATTAVETGLLTESAVISNLATFLDANANNITQILKNTQDPSTILALIPTLTDPCQQVTALQTLLTAQRTAAAAATPTSPVTLLSSAQCANILTLLYSIVCNRDALDAPSLQNLRTTLQIAAATPGLSNLTISDTGIPANANNNTAVIANIFYQVPAPSSAAAISITPLTPVITTDSILPGQSVPTSYDLTTALGVPVPFASQVEKLVNQMRSIVTYPSNDARRQQFFKYLGMVGNTPAIMDQTSLGILNTKVLVPLQNSTLTNAESSVISTFISLVNNPSTINSKALTNVQSPANLIATVESLAITPILNSRDAQIAALQSLLAAVRNGTTINPGPTVTQTQYQTIINLLYLISHNRDELTEAGMQNLTFTLQLAGSINGLMSSKTSLPLALPNGTIAATATADQVVLSLMPGVQWGLDNITTLATTPPSFHDCVTKVRELLPNIISLSSTDQGRVTYFQYLSNLAGATMVMQSADVATLLNAIVAPLQKIALSQNEVTVLEQIKTMCTNLNAGYAKILANAADPIEMLALLRIITPQVLQGTRDAQISALQTLLIAQRNASLSNPVSPLTTAQCQTIVNLLYVITQNRDELSTAGMQKLLFTLQLASANATMSNLGTLADSPTSSDDTLSALLPPTPARIADITELAHAPLLFSTEVAKLTTALSTILTLTDTNATRQAYFQYLSAIVTAANDGTISMQPSDLASLASNVVIPLQKGMTTSSEAAILSDLLTICNNVSDAYNTILRNTQDPANMLALLSTMAPLTLQGTRDQQVAAIQGLLAAQRNATSSVATLSASSPAVPPLTGAHYQIILNTLYLIALNRDELSSTGMQDLLTALQLAATNSGLTNLTTSQSVPLPTNSKTPPTAIQMIAALMPTSPASLSAITALANTPILFSAQVTKLLRSLTTIQGLPSTDPGRHAYFQYLNSIITAATNDTISMLPADLSNLANNIIIPLQKGAPNSAEAATLASLLTICNDVNDANSAILKNTQDPASMLGLLYILAPATLQGTRDQQIAALQNLLSIQRNATASTIVPSAYAPPVAPLSAVQYQAILNILYLITLNRDELSSTGTQNLLATLQLAAINNGLRNLSTIPNTPLPTDNKTQATAAQIVASLMPTSPTSISAITALANTPIVFSAQIAKLLAPLPTIQTLPSNDPSRQAYFQYLSNITNSTTAMQPSDITNMLNNVIAPLQKTPVSPNESAILGQLSALCSNYYSSNAAATILANIQDPVNMIALLKVMVPITLQGTRDAQITALQALLTAQRNGTGTAAAYSAAVTPLTQSQYQNILNLLYLITVNRDELSSNGIKILVQALQLANTNSALNTLSTASTSTTAIPSVPPSADDIIAALLPNTPATVTSLTTMVNTPFTFASQVAKVTAVTQNMILQPSTSAARQSYFQYLSMLPRTTLTAESTDLNALNSNVVTPLSQTPLAPNEQAVIANLQQFVANAKAAGYQLGLMPLISDWGVYISTLQSMLANQGISTIFATADYATFMNCLTILLNNREVLQANSLIPITAPANATTTPTTSASTSGAANTSQSALMQQFMTLLNSTYQAATFASFQSALTTMIATAPTDHIFSERVSYMQAEVADLTTAQQVNPNDPSIPITYNHLITKLGIILNATGAMTSSHFNSLQTNVITPLLALITNNPNTIVTAGMAQQIQAISNNIQSNKAAIIAQQATFAYQYSLAQLQVTNPSTYVSMLQGIISGQRQGTITFASGDAQTFLTTLANVVKTRDNLSTNDLTTLATAINFALYSDIYNNAVAQNTLQQLLTTAANPIPFADRVTKYSGQVKAMLKLQPANPERIAFFTCLDALPNAPGNQSTTTLNSLQTNIITPLASSPLSSTEKTTMTALQKFYTTAQANIRSASYQMNALLALEDINQYIDGLQDMITRQGSFFIFTPADYATFASQVAYIVNSRELLDSNGLTKTQALATTTLANANFTDQSATLAPLVSLIAQPSYFNDRVTWMATEVQMLVNRDPVSTDPMLVRFFTKLNLLLTASQVNTSDQQFNILQSQVLTPLGSLTRLSPDQQNQLQSLSAQFLGLKSQVLLNQTTFQYQFSLSQAQIANTDTYLSMLTNILVQQHNGSLTFSGNDAQTLLGALQALVNNRDILSVKQMATANTLFTYCLASRIYQDKSSQTTLAQLVQQLVTPIPLIQLVPKYLAQVPSMVFLPSTDPARILFFTQLNNMTQSSDQVPPALATQITTGLITPLNSATPSASEQNTLKNLQSFVANANQKAQSVSYLLQMADDGNLDLNSYATMVASIMQQKDAPLAFSANDETTAVGAFAYICACRELLSSDQLQAAQQLISNILFLGKFSSTSVTQLQTIQTTLNTPYLFQDRLNYASQEIKALRAGNANPAGNRIARLIARLGLILKATGPSTTADFNNLQAVIQQLQNMTTMPTEQMQTVNTIAAQMAANMSTILAAQQTFAYNYQQAQLLMNANNLSAYVSALLNIITLKRQNQMTFNTQDYATFIMGLTAVTDHQDAMSTSDITNLKTALNYTFYSNGFASYQNQLTALNALLTTPPTFGQRVALNISKLSSIMQLDSTDPNRIQFFIDMQYLPNLSGSGILTDVQNLVTNLLTPIQTAPISTTEQTTINTLNQFVASVQQQAVSLDYNLTQLAAMVKAAANTTSQDPVAALITGMNTIVGQITGGITKLNGNDYQTLVTMLTNIVTNNELLNPAQLTQVQTMLQGLQYITGFASFQSTLTSLYNNVVIQATFAQRVAKYVANFPQINSAPVGDPSKSQFITMVSTIFSAPGTMTPALLTTLKNQVINPIKSGNFTPDQQAQMSQLLIQHAAAETTANSFSYRLNAAQAEPTQQAEYNALTQMINDLSAGIMTMAPSDYSAFLSELTTQVTLRPLVPNTQSALYSLVALVKSAPTFSTRPDLVSTLTQLSNLLNTPVDPVTRITYFTQNTMAMLGKPITNGQRKQFFTMLGQFSTDLSGLAATTLAQPAFAQLIQTLITTLNQASQSPNTQLDEQSVMTTVARELQDISGTPTTTQTMNPASLTSYYDVQMPSAYNNTNVALPRSAMATTASPAIVNTAAPVSRFYNTKPIQRLAQ